MNFWYYVKAICFAILIITPIGLGYYGATIGHIFLHEEAHVSIFEAHGVPAEYNIDFLAIEGYTYPINMTLYNNNCGIGSHCNLLHEQNEIVGYNVAILIDAIFMMGGLLFCLGFIILMILCDILKKLNLLMSDVSEKDG